MLPSRPLPRKKYFSFFNGEMYNMAYGQPIPYNNNLSMMHNFAMLPYNANMHVPLNSVQHFYGLPMFPPRNSFLHHPKPQFQHLGSRKSNANRGQKNFGPDFDVCKELNRIVDLKKEKENRLCKNSEVQKDSKTSLKPIVSEEIETNSEACPKAMPPKETSLITKKIELTKQVSTAVKNEHEVKCEHLKLSYLMSNLTLKSTKRSCHETANATVVCLWKDASFALFFVFGSSTESRLCLSVSSKNYVIGEYYASVICFFCDEDKPHPLIGYYIVDKVSVLPYGIRGSEVSFENGDIIKHNADIRFNNDSPIPYSDGHFIRDNYFGHIFVPDGMAYDFNGKAIFKSLKLNLITSDSIACYWSIVSDLQQPTVVVEDSASSDYAFLQEQPEKDWIYCKN